jgi:hypothetical protein
MTYRALAELIYRLQPELRVDLGPTRHHAPERVHAALDALAAGFPAGTVRLETVGHSFEGRAIRLLTLGSGPVNVLLWSQMHGDEPTATAALVDVVQFLLRAQDRGEVATLLSALKIHLLPMLNPDGAVRCTRRTAQGIDMNRDALALVTPEAAILRNLQTTLRPAFGYNLHDQELSTTGITRRLSSIALLAPAFDATLGDNEVRRNAKFLGAAFAAAIRPFADGTMGRYDDACEPRAFGDSMQRWGTSTLLVESGHAQNDPQKESIRRLTVTGILSSLYALATAEYQREGTAPYEALPFNSKKAYDCIYRNVSIVPASGAPYKADLGVSSQVDTHSEPPPRLVDIGDLSTFSGWTEIDAGGRRISHEALSLGQPFDPSLLL